jgi:hypothetical protein
MVFEHISFMMFVASGCDGGGCAAIRFGHVFGVGECFGSPAKAEELVDCAGAARGQYRSGIHFLTICLIISIAKS